MAEEKTIYIMDLHEKFKIFVYAEEVLREEDRAYFTVLRVASGWIYFYKSEKIGTFVPFDNKFQIK